AAVVASSALLLRHGDLRRARWSADLAGHRHGLEQRLEFLAVGLDRAIERTARDLDRGGGSESLGEAGNRNHDAAQVLLVGRVVEFDAVRERIDESVSDKNS